MMYDSNNMSAAIPRIYYIKISFKAETRRLQLSKYHLNFHNLKESIAEIMPSLQGEKFLIQWFDDEVP